jgi:hypothetical protein
MLNKKYLKRGLIDPVTIIGVLFLIISLSIGTYIATNEKYNFNIFEKAMIDRRYDQTTRKAQTKKNNTLSTNDNKNKKDKDDNEEKEKTSRQDPQNNVPTKSDSKNKCNADGVEYDSGSVVIGGSASSGYSKCQNGRWQPCETCKITDLTTVPHYLEEKYKKAISSQNIPHGQQVIEINKTLQLESSECTNSGGQWINYNCVYPTIGERRCSGNAVESYSGGTWKTSENCEGGCVDGKCISKVRQDISIEKTDEGFERSITTLTRDTQDNIVPSLTTTIPVDVKTVTNVEKTDNGFVRNITTIIKNGNNNEIINALTQSVNTWDNKPATTAVDSSTNNTSNKLGFWDNIRNRLNNSNELPGLGQYGFGGGNAYIAPVPQNIIESQDNSELYNYILGNAVSAGAGFTTATLLTPGAPMFVFETVTSIPGALRVLTAADIADNVITGVGCASGNQESCSYFQSTLFVPAPTGVGNMLADSFDDFASVWRQPAQSLDDLSFVGSVLDVSPDATGVFRTADDPNRIAGLLPSGKITPQTRFNTILNNQNSVDPFLSTFPPETRIANTDELALITDLESISRHTNMLFAPNYINPLADIIPETGGGLNVNKVVDKLVIDSPGFQIGQVDNAAQEFRNAVVIEQDLFTTNQNIFDPTIRVRYQGHEFSTDSIKEAEEIASNLTGSGFRVTPEMHITEPDVLTQRFNDQNNIAGVMLADTTHTRPVVNIDDAQPNILDNINESFSNFWQNNVYSWTDGFLPKWTNVGTNPIANFIFGNPTRLADTPTPLLTRIGEWFENIKPNQIKREMELVDSDFLPISSFKNELSNRELELIKQLQDDGIDLYILPDGKINKPSSFKGSQPATNNHTLGIANFPRKNSLTLSTSVFDDTPIRSQLSAMLIHERTHILGPKIPNIEPNIFKFDLNRITNEVIANDMAYIYMVKNKYPSNAISIQYSETLPYYQEFIKTITDYNQLRNMPNEFIQFVKNNYIISPSAGFLDGVENWWNRTVGDLNFRGLQNDEAINLNTPSRINLTPTEDLQVAPGILDQPVTRANPQFENVGNVTIKQEPPTRPLFSDFQDAIDTTVPKAPRQPTTINPAYLALSIPAAFIADYVSENLFNFDLIDTSPILNLFSEQENIKSSNVIGKGLRAIFPSLSTSQQIRNGYKDVNTSFSSSSEPSEEDKRFYMQEDVDLKDILIQTSDGPRPFRLIGCGPTAIANIINNLTGSNISPLEIANKIGAVNWGYDGTYLYGDSSLVNILHLHNLKTELYKKSFYNMGEYIPAGSQILVGGEFRYQGRTLGHISYLEFNGDINNIILKDELFGKNMTCEVTGGASLACSNGEENISIYLANSPIYIVTKP